MAADALTLAVDIATGVVTTIFEEIPVNKQGNGKCHQQGDDLI
jgi:hypothetical protein